MNASRYRHVVVLILTSISWCAPLFADCQGSILKFDLSSTIDGHIDYKVQGQGSCGANGGTVELLVGIDGAIPTPVKTCLDGNCEFEGGYGVACPAQDERIELVVRCSKPATTGQGCQPDADGHPPPRTREVKVDNSLSTAKVTSATATGVHGTFHISAPNAGSQRVIHLDWLNRDGTRHREEPAFDIAHDGIVKLDLPFDASEGQPGATLIATLDSCGRAFSPVVLDTNGDKNCKQAEEHGACPCIGEPVRLQDGNMQVSAVDPLPSFGGMGLARTYDSTGHEAEWFGNGWASMFDRVFIEYPSIGAGPWAVVWLNGSKRLVLQQIAGVWEQKWPLAQIASEITTDVSTGAYILREPNRDLEVVIDPQSGLPLSYRSRATGRAFNISYNGTTPVHASDSWGNFGWTITTSNHRVDSISIDGTALVWQYLYSGGLLTAVNGPGGLPWRTYTYVSGRLTEVHDGAGNLLESHAYDGAGRATSSLQAADDIQSIQYGVEKRNGDSETKERVQFASGAVTNYWLATFGGKTRTVEIEGNCASCGVNDAVYAYQPGTYDAPGGQLLRMQDARGYITEWTVDAKDRITSITRGYRPAACDPETDPLRCHQTPDGLRDLSLVTTSAMDVTEYLYDDENGLPDRPSTIRRPSVAKPGQHVDRNLTYDLVTGVVLTDTTIGYVDAVAQTPEAHTTATSLYDGIEGASFAPGGAFDSSWLTLHQPKGFRKSVDGPRLPGDVLDVTRWVYYPVDNAVPPEWRGHLAAVRDAALHITRYENYDVFGNARRVIDSNGVTTDYTFDGLGRLLTSTLKAVPGCDTAADPLCATDLVTSRTYTNTYGPLESETRPRAGTVTHYEYDARGRTSAVTRAVTASESERVEDDYDPATGKRSAERYLSGHPGAWTIKRSEGYHYDTFGRLASVEHPDATTAVYTYDGMNHVATAKDENHAAANTSYKYDPLGRLVRVTQTLSTVTITTQYAYDSHGNLTSVIDPNGNTTSYEYDDFDRMTRQTSPVTGVTRYAYDLAGDLTSTVDANGATTTRAYDALARPTNASSARTGSTTETVSWTYDNVAAGAFGLGRAATMTDPTGSSAYSYERHGLLRREAKIIDDTEYVTTYQYDRDENPSVIGYPSGVAVTYDYDLGDRPISAAAPSESYVTSAAYLPFGPLTQLTYGNGTTRVAGFDNRYRPHANKLTAAGGGSIADYVYQSDGTGNVTQIHDAVNPAFNRDFGYDDLNRLTSANSGSSLWGAGSFTYDSLGDLLTSALGSTTQSFSYVGTTPKMSGVTYDAAGNEVSVPGAAAAETYSPRNLRKPFGYDGRGLRTTYLKPASSGHTSSQPATLSHFLYNQQLRLTAIHTRTWDDSGIVGVWSGGHTREIIWFDGWPVAQRDVSLPGGEIGAEDPPPSPSVRYTFSDHLGTPLLQTDEFGSVVWRAEYTPYGTVQSMRVGDATDQPLRLPGQDVAAGDSGVSYNIFRWYRAGWGRYTQGDPIGVGGPGLMRSGRLQRWPHLYTNVVSGDREFAAIINSEMNPYAYVGGNPLSFTDPLGLERIHCAVRALWPRPVYGECIYGGVCIGGQTRTLYVTLGGVMPAVSPCKVCSPICSFSTQSGLDLQAPMNWRCSPPMPIIGYINPNPQMPE